MHAILPLSAMELPTKPANQTMYGAVNHCVHLVGIYTYGMDMGHIIKGSDHNFMMFLFPMLALNVPPPPLS